MTLTVKQLLEAASNKTVVATYGRFSPPHEGHEKLVNAVKSKAAEMKADHVVVASHSQDGKKNPLHVDAKVGYMKKAFPNTNIVAGSKEGMAGIIHVAKHLSKTHQHLHMVVGSDRVEEVHNLLHKYNGKEYKFKSIHVHSAGARDPDAEGTEGMSATKMREHAKSGNFDEFRKGVPKSMKDADAKKMMHDVKSGLKEHVEPAGEVRDLYVAKKIFNEGSLVEADGKEYHIHHRGANHLILIDESGQTTRKWLNEVKLLSELSAELLKRYADKNLEYTQKPYTPEKKLRFGHLAVAMNKIAKKEAPVKEDLESLDEADKSETDPAKMPKAAVKQAGMKNIQEQAVDSVQDVVTYKTISQILKPMGHTLHANHDTHRKQKIKYKLGEDADLEVSDEEIDQMVFQYKDFDDVAEFYDENEFAVVDAETGEVVATFEESTQLDEVLSVGERIKAKARFKRTEAKRERAEKIALNKHSDTKTLNKRARRMAVKAIEKRLARKDLSTLSISEKERIEARVAKMGRIIDRVAMKMAPRVRQIEKERLAHPHYTKVA